MPCQSTHNAISNSGAFCESFSHPSCASLRSNNLLQGPYYTEVGMADIAHSIDARERTLMMENGADSNEYLSFMAQDSSNVDESGQFFARHSIHLHPRDQFFLIILARLFRQFLDRGVERGAEEFWTRMVRMAFRRHSSCAPSPEC